SAFVIATCGLVYELIAGTLASYLLGDSVTQFSTIIGAYLFAMGVGSWLSRYIERNLLAYFVRIELMVGAIGGSSAAVLFILFDQVASFRLWLYFLVGVIGILVGVEIPLLLRILEGRLAFKDLVSKVFTFDYVGALFASLLFPLVLVPHLGLIRSAFLFGILNTMVAIWMLYANKAGMIPRRGAHRAAACTVLALLGAGFISSERIQSISEASIYPGTVIFAESTPYQR
ncbi:MAG: polyamine aminopropyltransferase, partial [Mesorhizobium sp.]